MARIIKVFSDGSLLEFDQGKIDEYCVYLTRPGQRRHAPKDTDYFTSLRQFSLIHTPKRIYDDFVKVYNKTNVNLDPQTLHLIESISRDYGKDSLQIEILLTILYAGMIAEENKERKVLGKRLKRLGMHQLLIENLPPSKAASFSIGKHVPDLKPECERRGF